jgi:hypothetical protein
MVPRVCDSTSFVYASPIEAAQHATNETLVGQLLDSVHCWLSHGRDVATAYERTLSEFDLKWDDQSPIDVVEAARTLQRLEVDLSFYEQLDRDKVVAVRRVLGLVPRAQGLLKFVDGMIADLNRMHADTERAYALAGLVAAYVQDAHWTLEGTDGALPALFTALRAQYLSCPIFGHTHSRRFSGIMRFVVRHIEHLMDTVSSALTAKYLSDAVNHVKAKQALVAAQAASVGIQEHFHQLRLTVCDLAPLAAGVLYEGVDEGLLFDGVEARYERCSVMLHFLEFLSAHPDRALTGAAERLLSMNPVVPSVALPLSALVDAVNAIEAGPSGNPRDIVARIQARAAALRDVPTAADAQSGRNTFAARAPGGSTLRRGAKQRELLSCWLGFNPPRLLLTAPRAPPTAIQDALTKSLLHCCGPTAALGDRHHAPGSGSGMLVAANAGARYACGVEPTFVRVGVHPLAVGAGNPITSSNGSLGSGPMMTDFRNPDSSTTTPASVGVGSTSSALLDPTAALPPTGATLRSAPQLATVAAAASMGGALTTTATTTTSGATDASAAATGGDGSGGAKETPSMASMLAAAAAATVEAAHATWSASLDLTAYHCEGALAQAYAEQRILDTLETDGWVLRTAHSCTVPSQVTSTGAATWTYYLFARPTVSPTAAAATAAGTTPTFPTAAGSGGHPGVGTSSGGGIAAGVGKPPTSPTTTTVLVGANGNGGASHSVHTHDFATARRLSGSNGGALSDSPPSGMVSKLPSAFL